MFEMWYRRMKKKIRWSDHVSNYEVLQSKGGQEYPTCNKKEGKLTGLVTSWVGTALQNTLLKER
jgi:hypothetical protein